jgi:hypothetical protein
MPYLEHRVGGDVVAASVQIVVAAGVADVTQAPVDGSDRHRLTVNGK